MELFVEGLVYGIPAVFFVGPVWLTLMQASIQFGFRAGFAVAIGISVSDIVCIFLCSLGMSQFLQNPTSQFVMTVLGGFILLGFGVLTLFRSPKMPELGKTFSNSRFFGLFSKGFLVNFVNPFVFAFWIGSISFVGSKHDYKLLTFLLFFSGCMTTIFVTDVVKAKLGHKMRNLFVSKGFLVLNRLIGLCLSGFGLFLLWRAFAHPIVIR